MTYPFINIGQLIKEKMEEKGLNKSQLAKKMGMQRQNINNLVFAKDSLSSDLIRKACLALEYNFFADFFASQMPSSDHYEQHGDHTVMAKKIQTLNLDNRKTLELEESEYVELPTENSNREKPSYEELKSENSKLKDQLLEAKSRIIELMEDRK